MKILFIYIILSFLSASYLYAQKDVQAKAILNVVSAKYRVYNVVKTDFVFTLDNQQAGVKDSQTGTLLAKSKSNKFKVTLYSPATSVNPIVAQEIISDGKTQWTYLKKDNEVQVSNADNSGEWFNPAQVFTIYEHGYKYIYNGELKIAGKAYQEIDLTPEDIKKSFFKVRLLIDKAKKQIYNALIFDKNGNKYTYTLRSFTGNVSVPESTFSFDVKTHTGVEVVDLR